MPSHSSSSRTSIEKPLPQNAEAERSVLGAVLVAGINGEIPNTALGKAAAIVNFLDFFDARHKAIFRRMVAMQEAESPIDQVTLWEALTAANELEAAGGAAYLASLADGVPQITNVAHYAKI